MKEPAFGRERGKSERARAMQRYDDDAWWRLGRAVYTARMKRVELRNTKDWAAAVGVSTKTLLGLERGNSVHHETITAIEEVLGWPASFTFTVLDDPDAPLVPPDRTTTSDEPTMTGT